MSHPSQCRVARFPDDDLLRSNGWEVVLRPRGSPALWRYGKDGVTLTVEQAVLIAWDEEQRRRNVLRQT